METPTIVTHVEALRWQIEHIRADASGDTKTLEVVAALDLIVDVLEALEHD